MKLQSLLAQTAWLLLNEGTVSYSRLRHEFDLSEEQLDAIRTELILIKRFACDQNGQSMAWTGSARNVQQSAAQSRPTLPMIESGYSGLPAPARGRLLEVGQNSSGDPLLVGPVPDRPTSQSDAQQDGDVEHRHITVLLCKLADPSALSNELGPEDVRDLVLSYKELVTGIIQRHGGYVAEYVGEGILASFGYPKFIDRNAEQAVRSGLAIIEALDGLNDNLGPERKHGVSVKIGVSTALLATGDGATNERAAIDEALGLAARLQAFARHNGIIIGASTKDLLNGGFQFDALTAFELHGNVEAITAWSVAPLCTEVAATVPICAADSKSDQAALIGRDQEAQLLDHAWQSTKDEGRGQVVVITGEAGIGKSALVDRLEMSVDQERLPRITFRCSPYDTGSVLQPVIAHFECLAGWVPADTIAIQVKKLEELLARYSLPATHTVPLLANLMSLPLPGDTYAALDLSPRRLKEQLQETIIHIVMEEAKQRPSLLGWEDLHWADPSSLELLGLLIEQAPTAPLLVVLISNPEFAHPWAARPHVTHLALDRLERPHTEELALRIAGQKRLPSVVVDRIVNTTGGVPLYVEQLVRTIIESGQLRERENRYDLTVPLSNLSTPETLQDCIMDRLDRLPQARQIAQVGAVLGHEFDFAMLSGLCAADATVLEKGLSLLVGANVLHRCGQPTLTQFRFRHALFRDAAYGSLAASDRRSYHRRVAELIETQFTDERDARPEVLSHHLAEANDAERAIAFRKIAGDHAAGRAAYVEALDHYRSGLALLDQIDPTPEVVRHQLEFQVALAAALQIVNGVGSQETTEAYATARSLCLELGDAPELGTVLQELWRNYWAGLNVDLANDASEQLLRIADQQKNHAQLVIAHNCLGEVASYTGKLVDAEAHFEQAGAVVSTSHPDPDPRSTASDQLSNSIVWHGIVAWLRGRPDTARAKAAETIALARQRDEPYNLCYALRFAALISLLRGDVGATEIRADEAYQLATTNGFDLHVAGADFLRGWVSAMQGNSVEGLTRMRGALSALQATGTQANIRSFTVLLAEACGAAGLPDEGLEHLAKVEPLIRQLGSHWYEAELNRVRGELLEKWTPDNLSQAELCYKQAIDIAQRQGARSWELKSLTSQARLQRSHGSQNNARELLKSICNAFNEGLGTADLMAAKRVLLQE